MAIDSKAIFYIASNPSPGERHRMFLTIIRRLEAEAENARREARLLPLCTLVAGVMAGYPEEDYSTAVFNARQVLRHIETAEINEAARHV